MVEPKPSPFLIVEDDKSITPQWRKSLKRIPEKIRSLHNLPNLVSSIATAPALKGPSGGGGGGIEEDEVNPQTTAESETQTVLD